MQQKYIITFGDLAYDTLVTGLIMTLIVGGFGLFFIYYAIKNKVIYSREELFSKKDEYTNIQILLSGIVLLSISFWYDIYQGHIFQYIYKIQLFFDSTNLKNIRMSSMDFMPILLGLFIFLGVFGKYFSKGYANKINEMYILKFNNADKLASILAFFMMINLVYSLYDKIITFTDAFFVFFLIVCGFIFFLAVIKIKILFNDEIIAFYTFWRPRRIIKWKDVKKMTYEDTSGQNIILITKNNKKYKISTRLSGLESFIAQYKIRNKI